MSPFDAIKRKRTHLELCNSERSSKTHPLPVHEAHDMVITLHLLRSTRQPSLVIQPSLRLELLRVRAPDLLGEVDGTDRDDNLRAARDGNVVNNFA